jgi:hypothetical protein
VVTGDGGVFRGEMSRPLKLCEHAPEQAVPWAIRRVAGSSFSAMTT